MEEIILPPGKLGLELEPDVLGLKVRKWTSSIFQLSKLPPGAVLCSVDGVSLQNVDFSVAVGMLRDSRKRVIGYQSKVASKEDDNINDKENASINQSYKKSVGFYGSHSPMCLSPLVDRGLSNTDAASFFSSSRNQIQQNPDVLEITTGGCSTPIAKTRSDTHSVNCSLMVSTDCSMMSDASPYTLQRTPIKVSAPAPIVAAAVA